MNYLKINNNSCTATAGPSSLPVIQAANHVGQNAFGKNVVKTTALCHHTRCAVPSSPAGIFHIHAQRVSVLCSSPGEGKCHLGVISAIVITLLTCDRGRWSRNSLAGSIWYLFRYCHLWFHWYFQMCLLALLMTTRLFLRTLRWNKDSCVGIGKGP